MTKHKGKHVWAKLIAADVLEKRAQRRSKIELDNKGPHRFGIQNFDEMVLKFLATRADKLNNGGTV